MCLFLKVEENCAKLFGSDVFLRWKLSAEPSSCLNTTLSQDIQLPKNGYIGSKTFKKLNPYSRYRVEVGIGNSVGYNSQNSLVKTATTSQSGSKYSWYILIFNSIERHNFLSN